MRRTQRHTVQGCGRWYKTRYEIWYTIGYDFNHWRYWVGLIASRRNRYSHGYGTVQHAYLYWLGGGRNKQLMRLSSATLMWVSGVLYGIEVFDIYTRI